MTLDPFLIEILVDPEDKSELWYFADEDALYNPRLKRRYSVSDGIPILLVEEAETVDEEEARRLEARAKDAVVTGAGPTTDQPGAES
ncbi:MAG: Trm112 family protein [Acidimicrobiales bacterium]